MNHHILVKKFSKELRSVVQFILNKSIFKKEHQA